MAETALVAIPSFTPALSLVTGSVRSPHSKRAYRAALTDFLGWCRTSGTAEFSKAAVQEYRSALEQRNLSPSSIKLQMSAIRRNGVRLGNWLSLRQAEDLLALPDTESLKRKRDRAILSVLVAPGYSAENSARYDSTTCNSERALGDC